MIDGLTLSVSTDVLPPLPKGEAIAANGQHQLSVRMLKFEKPIDKTPKNRYILCINATRKSVCGRPLSREPGVGESPAGRRCTLSLLSRGGEQSVAALGAAPRYRGIKGHSVFYAVQFGWYRGM